MRVLRNPVVIDMKYLILSLALLLSSCGHRPKAKANDHACLACPDPGHGPCPFECGGMS